MSPDPLRSQWQALGLPQRAYDDLRQRYAEPHRRYHTLVHVRHCLQELETFLSDQPGALNADEQRALAIALWYHDAVYAIGADDNEWQSALLARSVTTDPLVERLIMATCHLGLGDSPTGIAEQVMVSVDLAILGQPDEVYRRYAAEIREEYAVVPDDVFRAGRRQVLEILLSRPLYPHPWFAARYEAQAKANLSAELAFLTGD